MQSDFFFQAEDKNSGDDNADIKTTKWIAIKKKRSRNAEEAKDTKTAKTRGLASIV